jgi:DNA-binding response OmpR family regulator
MTAPLDPRCPCCGSIRGPEGLVVDLETNTLTLDGNFVKRLQPSHAELLYVLLQTPGKPVSVEKVILGIWGQDVPLTARNILSVHAARMRTLLRPLGFDVFSTRSGRGKALVLARVAAEAAQAA